MDILYYNKPVENNIESMTEIIKDEIKNEIINELYIRQRYDQALDAYPEGTKIRLDQVKHQQSSNPYANVPMDSILEGNYRIHNSNKMIGNSDEKIIRDWIHMPQGNQKHGILYGIGTVALLGIFVPQFRQKVIDVMGNTALEGVELIEKARFLVTKAKEDMEDLIAEANFNNTIKKSRQ